MPNYIRTERATPYEAMVHVIGCDAPIHIHDLELDGNVERLRIGGMFGDRGWQIPATGLLLENNTSFEVVENVLSHHHACDGAMIRGAIGRNGDSSFSRLVCRNNGRQGLSIVAGRAFTFADCEFSHTGRSTIHSAPGAGVDVEAEGRPIRDLKFLRCRFLDNTGAGLVADTGDSEGAHFTNCLFVGTTNWSAWPHKPGFVFENCEFVGSVIHAFFDRDPNRATRFFRCRFTDDPKLSPTGNVYTGNGPIVGLPKSDNVLFDDCTFNLIGPAILPSSLRAVYRNCTMLQQGSKRAYPRGRYLGRSKITGNVELHGSMIEGVVLVNGKALRGPQGVQPW
jgi:hypothetical protein